MPAELTSQHTRQRYASIALRFPYSFATINRRVRAVAAETEAWWQDGLTAMIAAVQKFGWIDNESRAIRAHIEYAP